MRPTAGLGFKPVHFEEAIGCPAAGLWFEVHAENYMVAGGPRLAMLEALRAERPLSLHGVGLSLAGAERIDAAHLARLRNLADRFEPFLVSDHLAWSRADAKCLPDLLPFPRTLEALRTTARNVDTAQEALGRRILIENPSHYIPLPGHEWDEPDFLAELVRRTGCGLLIDVNNIWVSALPFAAIEEIHVAGHRPDALLGDALLIDAHDSPVSEPVWDLLSRLLANTGDLPVLLERDGKVPRFTELLLERDRAAAVLTNSRELADAC
ncbi:MAG: hypothetical protein FD139_3547 [Methylocystaceae bacterium]|nr:MAG: hypothetical protein FD148_2022 [Methylocystaceae bacterium]KAF0206640.1 MAG: hypothetical protein FD172_3925 [Methylocystaceae bacterium]TXT42554.1 MAG: hypothetical protein FD139_3547 [Methylocystaceae bacterium]